jgi:hypothetical protein
MATAFSIDRHTGTIRIGEIGSFGANQQKVEVVSRVSDLITRTRDVGNGYDWLDLRELTFGGHAATLSLCFHQGSLKQAAWSVHLFDAPAHDGWPTREAIDAELAFVRGTLHEMGIGTGYLSWGEVWSAFDEKGFLAANGLRYLRA